MMVNSRKQILLTNDDGIQSPGLWAAAEALSTLGYVWVVAPREQYSGAGRSLPATSSGRIEKLEQDIGGKQWPVHAVDGTPAQAVLHGVLEVVEKKPDLVVSGINYGENPGTDITVSGTVGAAMEAASLGIPALAVSLQIRNINIEYLRHSRETDFSASAYFTKLVADMILKNPLPLDVDFFKLDIPCDATPQTPWKMTKLARQRYFLPSVQPRLSWDEPVSVISIINADPQTTPVGSDIHALAVEKVVSLTPLSLDMTSRVDLNDLESQFRNNKEG